MKSDNTFIAGVAVEGTVYHFDKIFDYAVKSEDAATLQPGCRVNVPFARGNRSRQGMVIYVKSGDNTGLKYITSVLDDEPVLSGEMLSLVDYMHRHYYCTYFEAVKAMLPAGLNYNITTVYSAVPNALTDELTDEERRICDYVSGCKSSVRREQLMSVFGFSDFAPFERLVQKGYLSKSDDAYRRIGDKSVRMLRVCENSQDFSGKLTDKQQAVADLVCDAGEVSVKEVCYFTGVTQAVIDAVVRKGVIEYFDAEAFRIPETQEYEKLQFPVL
ncbi:MAG: primosomal protein N', partial [Ruminococcaceae bacterium]|nr:primosomal protein N' [Oscillospiraceae bacterium]